MTFQIPKTEWGPGPWQTEPDRKEWKAHGLDCLIVRNRAGALCGYAGVQKGHPLFGRSYTEEDLPPLSAHGGLTYSDACQGHICHEADESSGPVWWFGFDCAHAFDLMPAMEAFVSRQRLPRVTGDVYRDIDYVTREVEDLAKQLSEIGAGP